MHMVQLNYKTQTEKYEFISGQHGGYYRHNFIDHAYLYILYFPPKAVFTNFKNKIHDLVLNYIKTASALSMKLFIDSFPRTLEQAHWLYATFNESWGLRDHLTFWCAQSPELTLIERCKDRKGRKIDGIDDRIRTIRSGMKRTDEIIRAFHDLSESQPWFNLEIL